MEVVLDSEQTKNLTLGVSLLNAIIETNKNSEFRCDKEALGAAIKLIYSALQEKKIYKDDSLEKLYLEYQDEKDRRLPTLQIKLHPLDESIFELPHLQLYMHDYPKDKPKEDNLYLVKTDRNDFALLFYNTVRDEFLRPYDLWMKVLNVKGWIEFS